MGDEEFDLNHKYKLMLKVAKKLKEYHDKGKIHGNLHSRNVMLTDDIKVVAIMDSLKDGNKNTFYSSPENQHGIYDQCIDIYALGLMFYQLLYGDNLTFTKQFPKPHKFTDKHPYQFPLFPEEQDLQTFKRE